MDLFRYLKWSHIQLQQTSGQFTLHIPRCLPTRQHTVAIDVVVFMRHMISYGSFNSCCSLENVDLIFEVTIHHTSSLCVDFEWNSALNIPESWTFWDQTSWNRVFRPAVMAGDKFCLRWNEFEANLGGIFRDLRNHPDFSDITLACKGHQVKSKDHQ